MTTQEQNAADEAQLDIENAIFEEKMRRQDERVAMFKSLYDRGAFLIEATIEKRPAVNIMREDVATGEKQWQRSAWMYLERHIRKNGYILYYKPGDQGLLVLDFDPMVIDWLASVEDKIGAPPLSMWKSSGKIKPATEHKPSGIGGHAVWKIDPDKQIDQREFSVADGEFSIGQVFCGHKGYGFIVYDPKALLDAMDADDCEIVDATRVPKASPDRLSTSKWGSDWKPNPDSRHNSTISILATLVNRSTDRGTLDKALAVVERTFKESIGHDRDADSEWQRMTSKVDAWWDKRVTEIQEREAIQNDPSWKKLVDKTPAVVDDTSDTIGEEMDDLKDFPDLVSAVAGTSHSEYSGAEALCRKMGIKVVRECKSRTFEAVFKHIGGQARWVMPDEYFQLRVSGNTTFNDWVKFNKNDKAKARYLYQYGMQSSMARIVKDKEDKDKWMISSVPDAWWKSPTDVFNEFDTLKGTSTVPVVNVLEDMMRELLGRIDAMSDKEKDDCTWTASHWLAEMDSLRVPANEVESARAFSKFSSVMLAMRLLQNVPEFKQVLGVRPQRHVPVIAGPPGCGKSATWNAMLGDTGIWEPLKGRRVTSGFKKDILDMHRDTHGRVMNIYDELAGVYEVGIDQVKEFITDTHPVYDLKHMNSEARERTSFLCGTVNTINMPEDPAYRQRMFFVNVRPANPLTESTVQGKMVHDEINAKRLSIMLGGIIIVQGIMQQAMDGMDPRHEDFIAFEPETRLLKEQYQARQVIDNRDDPWKEDVKRMVCGHGNSTTIREFGERSSHNGKVFIKQRDAAGEVGLLRPTMENDTPDKQWKAVKAKDSHQLKRLTKLFSLYEWKYIQGPMLPDGTRDGVYITDKEAQGKIVEAIKNGD